MAQIHVESAVLPTLGWPPGKDSYPLDLDASQRYTRPRTSMGQMSYPNDAHGPGLGSTFRLFDVWAWNYGVAGVGRTFYQGGNTIREVGGTSIGIGGNPSNLPGLRG